MVKLVKKNPIVVIFATYIAIEICKVTGFVSGPSIQRFFELSNSQLGLILSSLSLGALLMNIGIGHISDFLGLWKIWKIGILGSIASIVLFFAAAGFWSVLIPLFLLGVLHVLTLNANNVYLSGEFKENSFHVMALASGLWFGSSIISTPLIGLWIEYANNAELGRMMFLVPYSFDILLLLAVFILGSRLAKPLIKKTEFEDRKNAEKLKGTENPEKRNIFGWVSIIIISYCHGTMIVGIITWANPMVQEKFAVADFYGSLTFAAFAVGLAAGRFLSAAGYVKLSTRTMLVISGAAGGLIFTAAMLAAGFWLTIIFIVMGGLAVSTTAPCILTLVPEQFPTIRAHLYGHMGASICIAAFMAPSTIGLIADYGVPINVAMLLVPIAALIMGITSFIWKLHDRMIQVDI
ncbi:D-galactonate transporter [Limihaloglobus sulfuriphilus]|uniref:D-galactonate transporter n=1 Tax=Limihaloglobus sulfuriphilus TaxID=1851148 RepID=A0A1Q2MIV4_9BACT|nr:MFS transporter [Limihaloglobus sulfuriphilus]AQQ72247.1 D-galactonate transporter [Limihaloglobus sulfuriphilus]